MPSYPPGLGPDVFISHASEDKEEIARPLAEALSNEGLTVWYDQFTLTVGDSLRKAIDQGLASCRFGIVILSPAFFAKEWPQRELNGLHAREMQDGRKVLLPVWHKVGAKEVCQFSPILADKLAVSTSQGLDYVVQEVLAAIHLASLPPEPVPQVSPSPSPTPGLPAGVWSLIFVILLMCLLIYYGELRHPSPDPRELTELLNRGCWVTYDPQGFDPWNAADPSLSSMQKDLETIRQSGFSGVVTFGSRGTLSKIPRLAKEADLKVIMGVWDPGDDREVRAAIRQKAYADAYCVGHNGLDHPDGYDYEELEKTLLHIKRRTGRPATTTERADSYDERLATLGDWLFPDVHFALLDQLNSAPCVSQKCGVELDSSIVQVAHLAQESRKPLMLKMVTYPWHGAENASFENQKMYLVSLLEKIHGSRPGLPIPTSIVIHSAFDMPWKSHHPFYPWDPYTGVMELDGTPRLAAPAILERCTRPRIH